MNLVEMTKIVERGQEFLSYMRDFYSLDFDGIYAEEFQFTDEEIIDGMNKYFEDKTVLKDILQYGADTVDREHLRDLILKMRGEA